MTVRSAQKNSAKYANNATVASAEPIAITNDCGEAPCHGSAGESYWCPLPWVGSNRFLSCFNATLQCHRFETQLFIWFRLVLVLTSVQHGHLTRAGALGEVGGTGVGFGSSTECIEALPFYIIVSSGVEMCVQLRQSPPIEYLNTSLQSFNIELTYLESPLSLIRP